MANVAHPFRERNGRTNKVILAHLAEQGPYAIEFNRVESIRWSIHNERSMNVEPGEPPRYTELLPVLDQMVVDRITQAADADRRGPTVAQLLAFTRGPESGPGAPQPGPLRYDQAPGVGQSYDRGRDEGLER